MDATHTRGPWRAKPRRLVDRNDREAGEQLVEMEILSPAGRVASMNLNRPGVAEAQLLADAALIAAAPELLTVAEGALGYLESLPAAQRPDEAWFLPLRTAIAKAKGA